jgi:HPt (histidine-containing phosphotransfer) domain-containing protein
MTETETAHESVINLQYLRSVTNNNESFMVKLIDKVQNQIPVFIRQIDEYFLNNDNQRLKVVSHKMANSMMAIGIKKAELALRTIEENITKEINLDQLEELISTVKITCQLATKDLMTEKQNLAKAE